MSDPRGSRTAAHLLVTLGLAGLASGCLWTQRWAPLAEPTRDPLPPGDLDEHRRGPEEVLVVRHADPVQVRPAGSLSGFPLTYWGKRIRLNAGSSVVVSAGGRAEVVWPIGSSIVLFGEGIGIIGSPSRGEPIFAMKSIDRAALQLTPGDQVQLVGGSLLDGDSGPYLVELVREDVVRVVNQSKGPLTVSFRQEVFDLGPGHAVDLPLLSSGGEPLPGDFGYESLSGPGFNVLVRGEVTPREDESGVRLAVAGDNEIRALGVRVRLADDEQVLFSGLGRGRPAAPPPPPDEPEEEEPPPEAPEEPTPR